MPVAEFLVIEVTQTFAYFQDKGGDIGKIALSQLSASPQEGDILVVQQGRFIKNAEKTEALRRRAAEILQNRPQAPRQQGK